MCARQRLAVSAASFGRTCRHLWRSRRYAVFAAADHAASTIRPRRSRPECSGLPGSYRPKAGMITPLPTALPITSFAPCGFPAHWQASAATKAISTLAIFRPDSPKSESRKAARPPSPDLRTNERAQRAKADTDISATCWPAIRTSPPRFALDGSPLPGLCLGPRHKMASRLVSARTYGLAAF